MQLPQSVRNLRYRIFYALVLRKRADLATLCAIDSICPWTICTTGLNRTSVVYSGGVGSDISFEHELVKKFGCNVVLLDPSPTGKRTMELAENKIPQFTYIPSALAARSGSLRLAPPLDASGDSWYSAEDGRAKVEVPCTDLATLMARNDHEHIDLLKLDIEGSEYEVLQSILKHSIPIRQICVEYHHGILPGIRRSHSIRSMLSLMARGYKLVKQEGLNHTFIREQN